MRKKDKKAENDIIEVLTQACDEALSTFADFRWLSHELDYSNIQQSLTVRCVFDADADLKTLSSSPEGLALKQLIRDKLRSVGYLPGNNMNWIEFELASPKGKRKGTASERKVH
ncbi:MULTISPECIES: Fis family transcriptional regulator [Zhongshania]|jgi:hypothetical protein|uniref:Fis family transcriptional regulator n=1 Tax=Zhongshania antarctica TaxID=641702 RepID=A0A840R195_9GAMM|nr:MULTISPECIES: Fis family transcriptional regulator [Zhongshania]MBB5186191.1 hypothetical protein [Zhongshania antarctica]